MIAIKLLAVLFMILLIPTLAHAVRTLAVGIAKLLCNIAGFFIRIKPCTCGEKTICVTYDSDNGYYLVCQNYKCGKSTDYYDTIIEAKRAWNKDVL
jgi:hypothetical protein